MERKRKKYHCRFCGQKMMHAYSTHYCPDCDEVPQYQPLTEWLDDVGNIDSGYSKQEISNVTWLMLECQRLRDAGRNVDVVHDVDARMSALVDLEGREHDAD